MREWYNKINAMICRRLVMILVVNTNTNDCKIYQYKKNPSELILIKEISHPENKLKISDLTADKEGHYKANGSGRGAYSPHTDAKEIEIINFSREIAQDLNQRRNTKELEHLILIAPPSMYGLLSQHMDKHVKELMSNHFQKDFIHMKNHELLDFLVKNTQYTNK